MEAEDRVERCRYFENLFSPYIAGDLDGPERRALAQHLHECEACAETFRLSWQAATGLKGDALRRRPREGGTRLPSRRALWLVTLFCLAGLFVLGSVGLLEGDGRGLGEEVGERAAPRRLVDERLARLIAVQTDLLASIVEPLRGARGRVSHAARGEAMDYFEALASLRARLLKAGSGSGAEEGSSPQARGPEGRPAFPSLAEAFHPFFRAVDPLPGGRAWSRAEWLEEWAKQPLPEAVLVSVDHADRRAILCTITWGKRPALAFLLRRGMEPPEGVRPGPGETFEPFVLAYLLFAKP